MSRQLDVRQVMVTLTHDQIKLLPSNAIELVPAPGEGRIIVPLFASVIIDTRAGAYSCDVNSSLCLMLGTTEVSGVAQTGTSALGTAGWTSVVIPPLMGPGFGDFVSTDVSSAKPVNENVALSLKDDWDGVANYTDGHPDNKMKVDVIYVIVNLSSDDE